jgi:group II intron reverse transcriptase/maturase
MYGNREVLHGILGITRIGQGRHKRIRLTCMSCKKSDTGIVPRKEPNKVQKAAEAPEGRPVTKENSGGTAVTCTQRQGETSNGLSRIREAARKDRAARFTALMHHITIDLLRESYHALHKDAAPGVDNTTWHEYGTELEDRLGDLHERVRTGRYRAKPSKRIWLPKPDGKERPIGIAAVEDKIVQQAVVSILNQIYEEVFLGFSYGFRPGRSPHHALDTLYVGITQRKVNWVLEVDVASFFDTLDHTWLVKFVERRIADPGMLRLIRKWLRAGVSEQGQWSRQCKGTPQGSVLSPLLANIYLHYVLDLWVNAWRKEVRGDVIIVRYADDFVLGFQYRNEAERCLEALRKRFAAFGLEVHPEKTRLIAFGRFAETDRTQRGEGKPDTFDFLGFTHSCAKTPRGWFTVRRKTIGKKLNATLKEVKRELRGHRHHAIAAQGAWLRKVVQGHLNYFAVPGNKRAIDAFRTEIIKAWFSSLRKRSQKARKLTWDSFTRYVKSWIPTAKVVHPYPDRRFYAMHPR